jgi:CRISPR/Cas system-associated endoribonuclease Cas2
LAIRAIETANIFLIEWLLLVGYDFGGKEAVLEILCEEYSENKGSNTLLKSYWHIIYGWLQANTNLYSALFYMALDYEIVWLAEWIHDKKNKMDTVDALSRIPFDINHAERTRLAKLILSDITKQEQEQALLSMCKKEHVNALQWFNHYYPEVLRLVMDKACALLIEEFGEYSDFSLWSNPLHVESFLVQFCKHNHEHLIKYYINKKLVPRNTLIEILCTHGNTRIIKSIFEECTMLLASQDQYQCALLAICKTGKDSLFHYLLYKHTYDYNVVLFELACSGCIKYCKILLALGADFQQIVMANRIYASRKENDKEWQTWFEREFALYQQVSQEEEEARK